MEKLRLAAQKGGINVRFSSLGMSKAIEIKKVEKEGSVYIGVELPYEPSLIEKIKQIPGREWSMSLRCWLVPYSKESYAQLKVLFGALQVQEAEGKPGQLLQQASASSTTATKGEAALSKVKMAITPKRIMLQLPKNETDLAFIRSLQYARWDENSFSWMITPTAQNEELLKRFFGQRVELITLAIPPLEGEQAVSTPIRLGLPLKRTSS